MNWKTLRRLNELYCVGTTSSEILEFPLVKRWVEMEFMEPTDRKSVKKTGRFDQFYKKELLLQYQSFNQMLSEFGLSETNFKERELRALLSIQAEKEDILKNGKSQKEIGTDYFDSAKYLTRGTVLFNAILRILEVTELPVDEHDQQFLYVLHCKNKTPDAIILCENDNQIRKPRLKNIELWFAGGRNTAKLKFITEPTIPFYYLCDWDNIGIEIYQDIKKNIFTSIEIIVPQAPFKLKDIIREWRTPIDNSLFSSEAANLLKNLIPEKWIEEESIRHDLLKR